MLLLTLSQQANIDASKRRDNHVWQLPQPPEDSGELVQGVFGDADPGNSIRVYIGTVGH